VRAKKRPLDFRFDSGFGGNVKHDIHVSMLLCCAPGTPQRDPPDPWVTPGCAGVSHFSHLVILPPIPGQIACQSTNVFQIYHACVFQLGWMDGCSCTWRARIRPELTLPLVLKWSSSRSHACSSGAGSYAPELGHFQISLCTQSCLTKERPQCKSREYNHSHSDVCV
jgi:hypothetical protein